MLEITRIIPVTPDREIRLVEAGRPDGIPVLALHGTPGSGLLYGPWIEDARQRGIRLLSYDRPGYGGSTPDPGRSVASAAADVRALAAALGIPRLCVWGVSGGGPHALACAARLPDLVAAAAALAAPAPYPSDGLEWFAGMGESNIIEFGAALEGLAALEQFVTAATAGLLAGGAQAFLDEFRSLLCPPDVAVLDADFAAFLMDSVAAGIKDQTDGWLDDDFAFVKPWDCDLDQIRIPLLLVHGHQDQMVPFAHGQWLARHLPQAEAWLLPDDGHLTLSARRVAEVHGWLLEHW